MATSVNPDHVKTRSNVYFKKEKALLKIFGISFSGNESIAYRIYSCSCILSVNVIFTVLNFREVFVNEFDVVADMLMYEFGAIMGLMKTSVVLVNRIKLGELLDRLEQEPFLPNLDRGGDEELAIIGHCIWITSAQTFLYWTCATFCLSFASITTLVKRLKTNDYHNWDLPYGPLAIVNATYSPAYEISWLYQNISVICIGYQFCTIDLITAALLAHVSFQFKILQNNFRRLVKNSYNKLQRDINSNENKNYPNSNEGNHLISWQYLKESIEEAVGYHLAIIKMADEIENLFSTLLMLVFLGTLGMLCFLVYRASLLSLGDPRLIRGAVECLTGCVQVLIICYWGNEVMLESEKVGAAAYEANFAGTDVRFQKALVLVIRRSQNPVKVTAGKFADICLNTFTWLLRTSYSAFMVLHKKDMQEPPTDL